ncbi:MAG: hypothetical protein AB1668_06865 [Nanoarchaeota archaeon]
MGKHKSISEEQYFLSLVSELNDQKETRMLALMIHLFVEYWINEIINTLFKNPGIIFKDRDLNGFNKKIDLLKACGIIKESSDLLKNIQLINQIRNDYAHNLIVGEIEKATVDRINRIIMLKVSYNNVGFASQLDLHSRFKAKAISTIMELYSLYAKLKGQTPNNSMISSALNPIM